MMPTTVRKPSSLERMRPQRRQIRSEHRCILLAAASAVGLGFLVRASYVLPRDFPLNDGGLFYMMVQELKQAHYRLPATSSYNFSDIPYGYSPLGFYLAALLTDLTPLDLLDAFRWLPLTVTTATMIAFLFLARAMLPSATAAVAAVFAFALIPRSFLWLLMGGGITRSLGFLFAILSLHQMYLLYTKRQWRFALRASLFSGLTVLSHLGTAPFLAFSSALFFLFYGRHARGVTGSLVVALGTIMVSAPWWGTVIARHGLEPFLAASATGGSIFTDSDIRYAVLGLLARLGIGSATGGSTAEALFPLLGTLALFGALASLRSRSFLLPAWWLTILLLEPRAGLTYATVPVSMLAGLGITEVLLPLLDVRPAKKPAPATTVEVVSLSSPLRFHRWSLGILGALLGYLALSAVFTHPALHAETRFLVSLSPEERRAMEWVATFTPTASRFLVLPESEWNSWETDKTSEWFPVLARRASVATVQGSEWIPHKTFEKRRQHFKLLRECTHSVAACLDDWSQKTGATFTHVYISYPTLPESKSHLLCCRLLIQTLLNDPRYELIYSGPGARIFARR